MTAVTCLIEPFHQAPRSSDVVACLRKLLNHRHARTLVGQRPAAERSWLLCGGRPDDAITGLRAIPSVGWPRGVYDLGDLLPLSLVVLSELDPSDDDTLPLRLMDTGATWNRALDTLEARRAQIPRGRMLYAAVVQMLEGARKRGARMTEEDMIDLAAAEEFLRHERAEALQQSRTETLGAVLPALLRLIELRLARPVTDDERTALSRRIDTDGARVVADALVSLDPPSLAAWLASSGG